eukprot:scaffold110857_cov72-Phaeocystis_antarctica.AAC.5
MSPDGDSGVTNSGTLNEMPPDGYLLAKEPCAGGAPPDGAYLERLANKDQVNTTEDGVTLDCGRDKVATSVARAQRQPPQPLRRSPTVPPPHFPMARTRTKFPPPRAATRSPATSLTVLGSGRAITNWHPIGHS